MMLLCKHGQGWSHTRARKYSDAMRDVWKFNKTQRTNLLYPFLFIRNYDSYYYILYTHVMFYAVYAPHLHLGKHFMALFVSELLQHIFYGRAPSRFDARLVWWCRSDIKLVLIFARNGAAWDESLYIAARLKRASSWLSTPTPFSVEFSHLGDENQPKSCIIAVQQFNPNVEHSTISSLEQYHLACDRLPCSSDWTRWEFHVEASHMTLPYMV